MKNKNKVYTMIMGANISKEFFEELDEKQIQQCGIDLKVGSISKLKGTGCIDYSNKDRILPEYIKIFDSEKDEYIDLEPGIYIVKVADKMSIPENMAGFAYPRSTLIRMGATLYTAVHDPGYVGFPAYALHVINPLRIKKYARIAQVVFIATKDSNGTYEGIYKE
ncbi:deoxyuridine 5'-triphosphate nucleotidohydrolase [Methanococcus voltae]|nr:deoxyuridine 5'-triphosphate nucleotidohydrolase [Methanococcus voltae]